MQNTKFQIIKSIEYVEKTQYLSYDLYDALSSSFLDKILKKFIFLRRVVIQINARSYINFRRLIGVPKAIHTKSISDLLSIYTMMYNNTSNEKYREKAFEMYDKLWERRIVIEDGFGWGLNYPYSTRFTNVDKNTPNLYNTINATHSIIDFYETFNSIEIEKVIDPVLNFILSYLGYVDIDDETCWLRYYPNQTDMPTPNVNSTAASLFVRINSFIDKKIDENLIVKLLNFVKMSQNEDGSWYYTTNQKGKWIDGFHSGFILESLAFIKFINPKYEVNEMLKKGSKYFMNELIDQNNTPKYFNTNLYPIDSQNCAQCIQTISKLIIYDKQDLKNKLIDVISIVNKILYDESGYFYHKKSRVLKFKNYYSRWSQTAMIQSLLFSIKAQEE